MLRALPNTANLQVLSARHGQKLSEVLLTREAEVGTRKQAPMKRAISAIHC